MQYIVDRELVSKFQTSVLNNGDIVIADTAEDESVGKCTEIVNVGDKMILSGLHTMPCRPKNNYASKFLGYCLNSVKYHDKLFPLMQGVKVTSISRSGIQNTDIIVPDDITEQEKIAEFLSQLNEIIKFETLKCEKILRIKSSMLEKMFPQGESELPDIRFEGFTDNWEIHELGDTIVECTERTSDFEKYPLYSLTIDSGITEKTERYERGFLVTKDEDLFKIVPANCFVTNPMNLRFGAVGFNQKPHAVSVSGYYDVFSIDAGQCSDFWYAYLKTSSTMKKYDDAATGSLIEKRRVHFSELKKIKLSVPKSMDEKKKIGSFFCNLDNLITFQKGKIEKLKNIKSACMKKMFV